MRIAYLIMLLFGMGSLHAQPDCLAISVLAPLDTWQSVSGDYDSDGWVIYEVTMYLGVDYVFKTGCGDGATADHNTVIEWMTPACTMIMGNDDGCENGRSMLSFNSFFSDGMVLWIRVRGAQGQGGAFTMAYRSIGGTPGQCNECPSYDEQLYPSSMWQTVDGTYGAGGCMVYRVITAPGLEYEFKTGCGDGATADHDTQLEVVRNGCIDVAADDDGCESGRSHVAWTAAASGSSINYVKVSSATGIAGTFTLAYRRIGGNGSVCSGCPVQDFSVTPGTNWATSTSSYLAGGCQIYRLSVTEGYQYTFKTGCGNGATADHDTFLELFDATCSTLATDDNGCEGGSSSIQYVAEATGILYLKVSGAAGTQGFYTLAYRRSGTCPTCPAHDAEITPTATWQTSSGSYLNDGCWMYKVNVTEGRSYVFQTAFGNGAAADHETQLQLYDDGCVAVADPGPWGTWTSQRLFHLATATGPVYLKVDGWGTSFGTHTLAYRDVGMATDACGDVMPIQFGEGSIQLAGSLQDATSNVDIPPSSPLFGLPVKWYAFDVEEPCYSFIVSYCGQDPAWTNTLDLLSLDCQGEELLTATTPFQLCGDGNVDYFFQMPNPGICYLPLLYDPVNSMDGAYTITVSCSSFFWDGVEEGTEQTWSVYPNPGGNELWLQNMAGQRPRTMVRILDPLGRMVLPDRVLSLPAPIDMGALPPGVYAIQVFDGQERATFRWVKE